MMNSVDWHITMEIMGAVVKNVNGFFTTLFIKERTLSLVLCGPRNPPIHREISPHFVTLS